MKVVVNELEGCKRGLQVEVPDDIVSGELERTLRDYSRRARVPGFRKGKIPMDVVRRRFGREVREEVVGRMVREYAARAIEEKQLRPVQAPVLDEVNYESGSPLVFKATFEVRPDLTVADYLKMAVSVSPKEVTSEVLDQSLAQLAERAARLEALEESRPVQKGDFAVGTLSCRFIKGEGKDLSDESLMLEAGAENNHPDFNAAVLGMSQGDSRSFETSYPEDWSAEALRGRTVAYTMSLKEIKKKVIPAIDDDLAKELGKFKDLAELKAALRKDLEEQAREAERTEAKNKIVSDLLARHTVQVPDALIEAELDKRLEMMVTEMINRGMDPTKAPVNWQEERDQARPAASDSVRANLIIDAIAAQEGIEASDEDVNLRLSEEAKRRRTSVAAIKQRLVENSRLSALRAQIVREKSLDFLVDGATITRERK
ncbi:MAG: trigger factor [Acidobacteriota bacterium]